MNGRLQYCGDDHGMIVPWPDSALNWRRETTADQMRIEWVLDSLVRPDSTLLHVGIGNSDLAVKFGPRVSEIVGVTLGAEERLRAEQLDLTNYRVVLTNKYGSAFYGVLREMGVHYDFIIDNNLGSYACCERHFFWLMATYQLLLKPEGVLLTDRAGLKHRADGDAAWDLNEDIVEIAGRFGLQLREGMGTVIGLAKK